MNTTVPMSVWNNVQEYFKKYLNDYILYDVIHYKNPSDSYLYMVIAKRKYYPELLKRFYGDRSWAVWTWNESKLTQCLSGGCYDIKTYKDALSICEEKLR